MFNIIWLEICNGVLTRTRIIYHNKPEEKYYETIVDKLILLNFNYNLVIPKK